MRETAGVAFDDALQRRRRPSKARPQGADLKRTLQADWRKKLPRNLSCGLPVYVISLLNQDCGDPRGTADARQNSHSTYPMSSFAHVCTPAVASVGAYGLFVLLLPNSLPVETLMKCNFVQRAA